MGKQTHIQWCDHTFNGWRGCTKISPGCANCYAEKQSHRNPAVLGEWGPNANRVIGSATYWRQPITWNRAAERDGVRRRVFAFSLADVFEDRADLISPRFDLWRTIHDTPSLDWLLLTKRPENWRKFWPCKPDRPIAPNVWFGVSVENQEYADRRIPVLRGIPAVVRWISYEPALGPVDFHLLHRFHIKHDRIDWIIVGGESGPHARPLDLEWARSTIRQCRDTGVACFVKQLGHKPFGSISAVQMDLATKGGDPEEWPEDIRIREFPQ